MRPSPEIEAAAAYVLAQADAGKSGAGLDVTPAERDFARQRLRAVAADMLAGLHHPEADPAFVQSIADSDRVLRTYAAPEYDCLNEDGKAWVAAIVAEVAERCAVRVERAPVRQAGNVLDARIDLADAIRAEFGVREVAR